MPSLSDFAYGAGTLLGSRLGLRNPARGDIGLGDVVEGGIDYWGDLAREFGTGLSGAGPGAPPPAPRPRPTQNAIAAAALSGNPIQPQPAPTPAPAPAPPKPDSYIRYQDRAGAWHDYAPGGSNPGLPTDPNTNPSGHAGTMSQIADIETMPIGQRPESYFDDLAKQAEVKRLQTLIQDPFAPERAKSALASADIFARERVGKNQRDAFGADAEELDADFQAILRAIDQSQMPQEEKDRRKGEAQARHRATYGRLLAMYGYKDPSAQY